MTPTPIGAAVGAGLWSDGAGKSSRGKCSCGEPLTHGQQPATEERAMGRGIYISLGGLILLIVVVAILL